MRTIFGLVGVLAVAIAAVFAWNWWSSNNAQVRVLYPTEGAALGGNTVPVRLSAVPELRTRLTTQGSNTEVITYLNGREVHRGKDLEYNLTAVPPGEHRLEIGISEKSSNSPISLNMMPRPVSFTLGGGSGANTLPQGVNGNAGTQSNSASGSPYNTDPNVAIIPAPTATPTPATYAVPASTPVAVVSSEPRALPASGLGGSQAPQVAAPAQSQVQAAAPVSLDSSARDRAILDGSQSQLLISKTQVNPNTVANAGLAEQKQDNKETPISGFFRWLTVFYVIGFVVTLGAIFTVVRARR